MPEEYDFQFKNCWMSGNTLRIGNMVSQGLVPEFIRSLKRMIEKFGHKSVILDFEEVEAIYPYPTAAIAGYIHYFKTQLDIEFKFVNVPGYLKKINFLKPKTVTKIVLSPDHNCLDHIWKFSKSEEVYMLVEGIQSSLRRAIECEPGVLDAVTWGLNETMDNVILHSRAGMGFVSAAVLKQRNCILICVFDYGIGIYNSLKNSGNHNPRSASDAISLAVKEGVTRDKEVGQGNGMWGLYNMVNLNSGRMLIVSGRGFLSLSNNVAQYFNRAKIFNKDVQTTSVSFRLNLGQDISIKEAIGGHEIVDLYLEGLEDEYERIIYKVSEAGSGVGTRESGALLRNEVINIIRKSKKHVVIDFEGLGIISSSFADEFLGKLIVKLGFFQFQKVCSLENMNSTIQSIAQRSISLRMAESTKR